MSSVVSTRVTQRGWVIAVNGGLDGRAVAADLGAGQGRGELAQGSGGFGQGLGEAGGLGCVQGFGVGQDHPPVGSEHACSGVVGA